MVLWKSYKACLSVYVPTVDRYYLAICCECFLGFIGNELGKLYDCYIADPSTAYTERTEISVTELQVVLLEE